MRRRTLILCATGLTTMALLLAGAGAAFAGGWHVVKSKSAHGPSAIASVAAILYHPHHVAVRLVGGHGLAIWSCAYKSATRTHDHHFGPGTHRLSHVGGSLCDISVSISGDHRVKVQILKRS